MLIYQLVMVINLLPFLTYAIRNSQPTHLHGHILNLILSPSDQDTIVDIKICDFISDHVSVNMFDLSSDLTNTAFIKSPASAAVDLNEQYMYMIWVIFMIGMNHVYLD